MSGPCARRRIAATLVLGALGACGGGGGTTPHDASPDTPAVCSGATAFTGDIVDWDSTEARFCGVYSAKWTVRSDTACTSTTAPNGRFQLQIPHQAQTVVDVAPPAAGSECPGLSGTPMNTYQLAGVAIASDAVVAGSAPFSFRGRAMVQARIASMFVQIGQPFAADHGQLVVHVIGTPRQVSISAAHAMAQRFDGATWAAGDIGSDVFFPNVDLSGGAVTVSMTGASVGTGSYTLEPAKLTYLSVIAQ
ncbi:MAG TPA: hypothetical protein VF469_05470 [Kofleriaceae bacterium]